MRIHYKDALAIIKPFGFLKNEAKRLSDKQIQILQSRRIECVLVSFKDIVYFDKQDLANLIATLQDIATRANVNVGFCDYSTYKHHIILKNLGVLVTFSLFETYQVASLFFGRLSKNKLKEKILLFNSNVQKRDLIQKKLQERGYECDLCKNYKDFISKKNEYKYCIGSWTTISINRKTIEVINRDDTIIYKISGMIDSEFESIFDMDLHMGLMASGFKFFAFVVDAANISNIIGANFLVSLSKQSSMQGAIIGIYGINKIQYRLE